MHTQAFLSGKETTDLPSVWCHYGEQNHSGVLDREECGQSCLCPLERGKSREAKEERKDVVGLQANWGHSDSLVLS